MESDGKVVLNWIGAFQFAEGKHQLRYEINQTEDKFCFGIFPTFLFNK